jgi:chaperone BCS1
MSIQTSRPYIKTSNAEDEKEKLKSEQEEQQIVTTRAYYEPSDTTNLTSHPYCWQGTWMTVTFSPGHVDWEPDKEVGGKISLRLYTTDRKALDSLIEEAARRYQEGKGRKIIVYMSNNYEWTRSITKTARSLESVILPDGLREHLVEDAQDFLRSKSWYTEAGIPHRRGYLLWGLPGTGKSSTIHALASELDLPIYCLSLSNSVIDDSTLQVLISATPENCFILIEDIDCAFLTSREDEEKHRSQPIMDYIPPPISYNKHNKRSRVRPPMPNKTKNEVTLAGLLNLLDSVTSEEGRLIFATTNYIEKLDPALLRPGRMDVKIQFTYATRSQARRLYRQIFTTSRKDDHISIPKSAIATPPPESDTNTNTNPSTDTKNKPKRGKGISNFVLAHAKGPRAAEMTPSQLDELAEKFGKVLPGDEFTMAELQGYLLTLKWDPVGAVEGFMDWVETTRKEKRDREERVKKMEQGEQPNDAKVEDDKSSLQGGYASDSY